jgi:hypothetical protein
MRGWRSKLGVSTVIANMLMILITLSLAAILVAWAGTAYGTFAGGAQIFFAQRGQSLEERFVIEYVYFIPPGTVEVFARNVGSEQIQIAAIYVNGAPSTMVPKSPCSLQNNAVTLTVGQACEIDIPVSLTSGSSVYMVAASLRGNQAAYCYYYTLTSTTTTTTTATTATAAGSMCP